MAAEAPDTTARPAPPEQIRAVPVRHPGRWVAAAVIAVLAAMFVHMLATNPVFQWGFMVDNMFTPAVLRGARTTLVMTVAAMVLGVLLGVVLAVMRLSPNPVVSGASAAMVGSPPGQPTVGSTVGSSMAPSCTPHRSRTWV